MEQSCCGITRLEIDLDIIAKNYQRLKDTVLPSSVMPVLKDNAYGHGLVRIAQRLCKEGCGTIACATLNEALLLKKNCSADLQILLLRALTDIELQIAVKNNFQITINSTRTLLTADKLATAENKILKIHLKIDTGLGRLGLLPDEAPIVFEKIKGLKNVRLISVFSHLAVSYQKHEFSDNQLSLFRKISEIAKFFFPEVKCHIAATAGVISLPDSYMDMVRVSSLLYGLSYSQEWPWGIEPALRWITPVIQAKQFPEGWNIGYKLLYKTKANQKIGVLAVGAGDNYPYALRLKSDVLICGKRCKVVGMSLDQTMVDLTPVPDAQEGYEAVLIGKSGEECIRAEELGVIAGTSPADILSKIPSRIPRYYYENEMIAAVDDCCGSMNF